MVNVLVQVLRSRQSLRLTSTMELEYYNKPGETCCQNIILCQKGLRSTEPWSKPRYPDFLHSPASIAILLPQISFSTKVSTFVQPNKNTITPIIDQSLFLTVTQFVVGAVGLQSHRLGHILCVIKLVNTGFQMFSTFTLSF